MKYSVERRDVYGEDEEDGDEDEESGIDSLDDDDKPPEPSG